MDGWYHAYGQKPTAVSHSHRLNLFKPYEPCLVAARVNHLDIYEYNLEGLILVQELDINGRIAHLGAISSSKEGMDVLVVLTEELDIFLLAYNEEQERLDTVSKIDLMNDAKIPIDVLKVATDPDNRMIVTQQYVGEIEVINMHGFDITSKRSIRHGADRVLGITMLHGCKEPTIAILQEDNLTDEEYSVRLGIFEIKRNGEDSVDVTTQWKTQGEDVSAYAHSIYAVPNVEGGLLIFCETGEIIFTDRTSSVKLPTETEAIQCLSCIDSEKLEFLVGDQVGEIGILKLNRQKESPCAIVQMVYEKFGKANIPSSLTYLEDDIAFVGSIFSDSQVLKLVRASEMDGHNSLVVLDEYRSLAPIMDMCIVDQGEFGKKQIITASGVGEKGSLRVVRQGVSVTASATVDLEGATKIWSLATAAHFASMKELSAIAATASSSREDHEEQEQKKHKGPEAPSSSTPPSHDTLAVAFGDSLAFLQFDDEDLSGVDIEIEGEGKVHYCGSFGEKYWIIVQGNSVTMLENSTFSTVAEWKSEKSIGACGCHGDLLLIGCGNDMHLFNLAAAPSSLVPSVSTTFEKEIASLAVYMPPQGTHTPLILASLWETHGVHLLSTTNEGTTLTPITSASMNVDVVSTSCALCMFFSQLYALFGLGDGTVYMFHLTTIQAMGDEAPKYEFVDAKRVQVGKRPVDVTLCKLGDNEGVFATSNEALLFYPENKSIAYASVNGEHMNSITFLDAAPYRSSYAYVTSKTLSIGELKSVQKLHITTIPLEATPTIMTQSSDSSMIAVGLHKENPRKSEVRLFSTSTMDYETTFDFQENEWVNCIHVHNCGELYPECYFFGTAFVESDCDGLEPVEGRIVVATLNEEKKFKLLTSLTVKGSVYSMCNVQGFVAATINSRVILYELIVKGSEVELKPVCGHHGHGMLVTCQAIDDILVVGDWFKSSFLLKFSEKKLTPLVEAPSSSWLAAAALIDQSLSFSTDCNGNIFVNKLISEEDRDRFEAIALWHVGEHVNVFRKGYLCDPSDTDPSLAMERASAFVYGTISGSIGCLIPLSKTNHALLREVEGRVARFVPSPGKLRHDLYRNPKSEKMVQVQDSRGIVDGALVEKFLNMTAAEKKEICQDLIYKDFSSDKMLPATVEVVEKIVLRMTLWH